MEQSTDDRLAQLARQIRDWQFLHPIYMNAPILCVVLSITWTLALYYNGWSYGEASLWLKMAFWVGYAIGPLLTVLVFLWDRKNKRKLDDLKREFEREGAKRGL